MDKRLEKLFDRKTGTRTRRRTKMFLALRKSTASCCTMMLLFFALSFTQVSPCFLRLSDYGNSRVETKMYARFKKKILEFTNDENLKFAKSKLQRNDSFISKKILRHGFWKLMASNLYFKFPKWTRSAIFNLFFRCLT